MDNRLKLFFAALSVVCVLAGASDAKIGLKIGHASGPEKGAAGGYYFQGFTVTSGTPLPMLEAEITYCGANFNDINGTAVNLNFTETNLLLNFPVVIGKVYGGLGGIYSNLPQQTTNLANFTLQGILGVENGNAFAQLRVPIGYMSQQNKDWIGTYTIDFGYRI